MKLKENMQHPVLYKDKDECCGCTACYAVYSLSQRYYFYDRG